jgi:methionine-rich copper-binding protein CopC
MPGSALAHAELVRAIPADGATVTEPVTIVSGRYTEDLTADSSLLILDASGTTIATGGVDPNDDRRMIARPDPPLTSGTFTVRSTAVSQVDGHPERETWTFTVMAIPTKALPSRTPVSSGSAPSPSSEPTPSASAPTSPASTPSPSPSAGPSDPATSVGDVALPIIAALAIVLLGAGALLRRGRRPGAT